MSDLFEAPTSHYQPLAEQLRPQSLADYIGQSHLLAPDKPLQKALSNKAMHSMIFWGPPGTGKTSLAHVIAQTVDANFEQLSAVQAGIKDIKNVVEKAKQSLYLGRQTLLFIDEIHRFNKAQQDAFLPFVEDGTFILIGATTENPSFELNSALLSRARVYVLKSFTDDDLMALWQRAQEKSDTVSQLVLEPAALDALVKYADGDARRFLNIIEIAADFFPKQTSISVDALADILQAQPRRFDKQGEYFYDQISAFHKSVRGSSPDGALYWLTRMLDGGIEPLYLARRMVRIASEDIGNADPRALSLALNAWEAQERLGSPEGELSLAQAAIYLASAPKSNAVYVAYKAMKKAVSEQASDEVPLHLRNAPTELMKSLDYGQGYRYAHDEPEAYAAGEQYLPEPICQHEFYQPVERGLESKIKQKLAHLRQLDEHSTQKRGVK